MGGRHVPILQEQEMDEPTSSHLPTSHQTQPRDVAVATMSLSPVWSCFPWCVTTALGLTLSLLFHLVLSGTHMDLDKVSGTASHGITKV